MLYTVNAIYVAFFSSASCENDCNGKGTCYIPLMLYMLLFSLQLPVRMTAMRKELVIYRKCYKCCFFTLQPPVRMTAMGKELVFYQKSVYVMMVSGENTVNPVSTVII